MTRLPATVAAEGSGVGSSETTAATAAATPTTTATPATPSATTAATAVADHLGKTRVNLLLGLSENGDEVTSLLSICRGTVRYHVGMHKDEGNILSVVKKVMAVPLAPARPVRPMRWT